MKIIITIIGVVIVIITTLVFFQNRKKPMVSFDGYSITQHKLNSEEIIRATKNNFFKITWERIIIIPDLVEELKVNGINTIDTTRDVEFIDVEITNLKTNETSQQMNSGYLELKRRSYGDYSIYWKKDEAYLVRGDWVFNDIGIRHDEGVDYKIQGKVLEMNKKTEEQQVKEFNIFIKSEKKTMPKHKMKMKIPIIDTIFDHYEIEWRIKPAYLLGNEEDDTIILRDIIYDNKLREVLTLEYQGKLKIENGELVFKEIPEKAEAYYRIRQGEDEYKWVEGELIRERNYETKYVKDENYNYESIYEK